jgi:phosphoribosylglycinamide formyltransferase 1
LVEWLLVRELCKKHYSTILCDTYYKSQFKMNIAIFASGGGSNAEVIIKTLPALLLEKKTSANIALIVSNNAKAAVLHIAAENNIASEIIEVKNKSEEELSVSYLDILTKHNIGFIVLAGYLKKIPTDVIKAFPQKIINIHPALLPAYGGAGMYGMRVHEAVVNAGEKESGISIHFVDEVYDNGEVIFQETCDLEEGETAESLSKKVQGLEHAYYSRVIGDVVVSLPAILY